MTVSRIGLLASALLLSAVLLRAPAAVAHSGGGHGHGHRMTIHVPSESHAGNSKRGEPGGVPVHPKAPARIGPPPYSWDDDGRLVSHGGDDGEGGGRGDGERSSSGGGAGSERGDR